MTPTPPDLARPPPSARGERGPRQRRWKYRLSAKALWVAGAALVAAGLGVWAISRHVHLKAISDAIAGFNPVLTIGLMAVLPLLGFSISIVYLVVGARFGPGAGLAVVTGVTAFHLLATYAIARGVLRGPIERFLERRGYHLPHILPGEQAGICLLGVLVPGLPYFARNYLLALTEIPLRIYFWVCLPVYVARSYLAILIGDLTSEPSRRQFALLAGVYVVKLGVCAYVVWRLRRGHPQRRSDAHGEN